MSFSINQTVITALFIINTVFKKQKAMDITSRNTVIKAKEITENANYEIEYSVSGKQVNRVSVSIFGLIIDKITESSEYIGNILLENNSISCSLPSKEENYVAYFTDFSHIVSLIKEEVGKA